jgi:hypothetical protein
MLLNEIQARYRQDFTLQRTPFDRLLDYVAAQSQDAAQAFYVKYLEDALEPEMDIPFDPFKATRQVKTASIPLHVIEQNARSINVSLHILAQTAFGVALCERHKLDDFVCLLLSFRAAGY